jgi:diaminohydroxyphosphoribosylaminopyrimidine deaminase / 5-amino-6-(5-phosphoribosylamino)uracil reductase
VLKFAKLGILSMLKPKHLCFLYFCSVEQYEKYMQRCLRLAEEGRGYTKLNPMVGCVIVHDDQIIGEGFHTKFGMPHAEVEAVSKVKNKSLLANSVMYVSLEPCCHHGKTPPCTSLIISHKIPKVVVAMRDPNPKVAGKGIEMLRSAGIEVIESVLQDEAEKLNVRFIKYHTEKKPYVILKWAQSADGLLDCEPCNDDIRSHWISNEYSTQLVHKWRSHEMSIMVGRKTAERDNPSLTTRLWNGNHPVRILIDPFFTIPIHYNIYNNQSPLIVIHNEEVLPPSFIPNEVKCRGIHFSENVASQILDILCQEGLNSVIIEGGRITLDTFIHSNLWDEARVIKGSVVFHKGTLAPELNVAPCKTIILDNDTIEFYKNSK